MINLLDQKLYNLNPDFLSYTLSKAALHTATTMLAQALAPTVRVVGVAPGMTMVSGDQSAAGFAQRAPGHAAGALEHARKTSPTPSATWPARAPSPAPPCWSTAAST